MHKLISEMRFLPKLSFTLAYLILLFLAFGLFNGRKHAFFQIEFLMKSLPSFYQHISNFSISYILSSGIGFMWLWMGLRIKHIFALILIFIILNFIYELWIPVLNTPDIVDAYYGSAGATLAMVFLILMHKYGLNPNPEYKGFSEN